MECGLDGNMSFSEINTVLLYLSHKRLLLWINKALQNRVQYSQGTMNAVGY